LGYGFTCQHAALRISARRKGVDPIHAVVRPLHPFTLLGCASHTFRRQLVSKGDRFTHLIYLFSFEAPHLDPLNVFDLEKPDI
jgi:hypothetical protein